MKISGKTLIVLARQFDRTLLDHIAFEKVKYIKDGARSHRGQTFKTVIFAGFDERNPPSEELLASIIPCVDRDDSSAVLFTLDGEAFMGKVEHVIR